MYPHKFSAIFSNSVICHSTECLSSTNIAHMVSKHSYMAALVPEYLSAFISHTQFQKYIFLCLLSLRNLSYLFAASPQPASCTKVLSDLRFILIGLPHFGHFGTNSDGTAIFSTIPSGFINSPSVVLLTGDKRTSVSPNPSPDHI